MNLRVNSPGNTTEKEVHAMALAQSALLDVPEALEVAGFGDRVRTAGTVRQA